MMQVTSNVYVEGRLGLCNMGFITTSEGIVMIDAPASPNNAVKWRDEIAKKGILRYIITSEEHADHCNYTWFFPGILISSQETRRKLAQASKDEIMKRVEQREPNALPLMQSFELRLADFAFTGELEFHLGDHTFRLFSLPGHSPGGIGIFIPEERVVFTADCVFHHVKTWLQDSMPDQWLESIRKISALDVDVIVPGHGDICKKSYLEEQANIIQQWVAVVKSAIKQGISKEEAVATISGPDPYPKAWGVSINEADISRMSVAHLYQLYFR